jgi:hypothetical protein
MQRRPSFVATEILILLCAAASIAGVARASVQFVASAEDLASNDAYDWGSLGAATNPIHVTSVLGNELTISLAQSNAAVVHQGYGYAGSFPFGTYALYNQLNGDYTIVFGSPVKGFGTDLDDAFQGAFDASIEALNGTTSLGVFPGSTIAHTLLYLGVSDDVAEVTSVKLHESNNDFAIGPLSLITTVPEAAGRESCEAATLGLLGLVALRRRR